MSGPRLGPQGVGFWRGGAGPHTCAGVKRRRGAKRRLTDKRRLTTKRRLLPANRAGSLAGRIARSIVSGRLWRSGAAPVGGVNVDLPGLGALVRLAWACHPKSGFAPVIRVVRRRHRSAKSRCNRSFSASRPDVTRRTHGRLTQGNLEQLQFQGRLILLWGARAKTSDPPIPK